MKANDAATLTPLASRQVPPFTYQRTPTSLLPMPTIPERIILPSAEIHQVFALVLASDDAREAQAFGVRWQVYCQELGFEPAGRFPDRREHDAVDERSVQVVALHRASGLPVGCFRLVMADPQRPQAPWHVEEVARALTPGAIPAHAAGRLGCAELSRFCIIAPFRRFDAGSELPPAGIGAAQWAAETTHRRGLAGLMWLAAAHIAVTLRLDWLLTLMEPRLQVLGRTLGLDFQAIGAPVDFRGERRPYRLDRRSLRLLLDLPQTSALVAPLAAQLGAGIAAHPMLRNYLAVRTERIGRDSAG